MIQNVEDNPYFRKSQTHRPNAVIDGAEGQGIGHCISFVPIIRHASIPRSACCITRTSDDDIMTFASGWRGAGLQMEHAGMHRINIVPTFHQSLTDIDAGEAISRPKVERVEHLENQG